MRRPKDCAPAGQGAEARGDTTTQKRKHTGGRPPVQGNRTDRNPSQPAPRWEPPRGQDAANDVAHALRGWTALLGCAPRGPRGRS